MVLVPSTLIADNWLLSLVKAGVYSEACIVATKLAMSKPRSAKTILPGNSFLQNSSFLLSACHLHVLPNCQKQRRSHPGELFLKVSSQCYDVYSYSVMMFIVGPCDCPGLQTRRLFYKNFETVNDNCHFCPKRITKTLRHCLP